MKLSRVFAGLLIAGFWACKPPVNIEDPTDTGTGGTNGTTGATDTGDATPAILSFSLSSGDFGGYPVGTQKTLLIQVTNGGGLAATGIAASGLVAPFDHAGGAFPGTSGTCGTSLAPGASCAIQLQAAGTVAAADSGTYTLDYQDGIAAAQVSLALSATARARAVLSVVQTAPIAFGATLVGGTSVQLITLRNDGDWDATGLAEASAAAGFAPTGGAFPGTNGTCGPTLAPAATCDIELMYAPVMSGAGGGNYVVGYHDGGALQQATVALSSSGVARAAIGFSVTTLSFPAHPLGVSPAPIQLVTLTNSGDVDATGAAFASFAGPFSGAGAWPGSGGSCGATLAPNAPCTIALQVSALAAGLATGTLTVSYNDGLAAAQATLPLDAPVKTPGRLVFVSSNLPTATADFGLRTTGASAVGLTVQVRNDGEWPATGLAVDPARTIAAPFALDAGSLSACATSIAPAATCALGLSYLPTDGSLADTLGLLYESGAAQDDVELSLLGAGGPRAVIALSGAPFVEFDEVVLGAAPARKVVTVTNTGGSLAQDLSGTFGDGFGYAGGDYPGLLGDCEATLEPGDSCSLDLAFAPAVAGAHSELFTLSAADDLGAIGSASRELRGAAVRPAILTLGGGDPVDAGERPIGSEGSRELLLSNTGDRPAVFDMSLATGPFSVIDSDCQPSLPPGDSCVIVLSFEPSAALDFEGTLTIDFHNGAIDTNLVRDLKGKGLALANLVVLEPVPFDFGTVGTNATLTRTMTLKNTGDVAASNVSASFMAPGNFAIEDSSDCDGGVLPGATCELLVSFTPPSAAPPPGPPFSDNLKIEFANGAGLGQTNVALEGHSQDGPLLVLKDDGGEVVSPVDYGDLGAGVERTMSFTVENVSLLPANITSVDFTDSNLHFVLMAVSGTCVPGTLSPASSCTLEIRYTAPNLAPPQNLTRGFLVDYDGPDIAFQVRGGTTTAPLLIVGHEGGYDFGAQVIGGTPVNEPFLVKNVGGTTIVLDGASTDSPDFATDDSGCPASLEPNEGCTIAVTYTPSPENLEASATLTVAYDGGATVARALTGRALRPGRLVFLDGASLDFGDSVVGLPLPRTLVVRATGDTPVELDASFSSIDPMTAPFDLSATSCVSATTLYPNDECSFDVEFVPDDPGLATAEPGLVVTYQNDLGAQSSAIALSGTGLEQALLVLDGTPNPLLFGSVLFRGQGGGGQKELTATVRNVGGVPATIADIEAGGTGYSADLGNCPASLLPNESCEVNIVFAPEWSGFAGGTAKVGYDPGIGIPVYLFIYLEGDGVRAARLALSPGDWDFEQVAVDQTVHRDFVLSNEGEVEATDISVGLGSIIEPAPTQFVLTPGDCDLPLAPATSCTFGVDFTPTAVQTYATFFSIGWDDGIGPAGLAGADLVGDGALPPSIVFYPELVDPVSYDLGTIGVDAIATRVIYLFNEGGAPAEALNLTLDTGTAFTFAGGIGAPGHGGDCGTRLAGGETCTVIVALTAGSPGPYTDQLFVDYTGGATATVNLSGEVVDLPMIRITDWPPEFYSQYGLPPDGDVYSFGTIGVGQNARHVFYLQNVGSKPATNLALSAGLPPAFAVAGGGAFPGEGGTCGGLLMPDEVCRVVLEATGPALAESPASATLSIAYQDPLGNPAAPATRDLSIESTDAANVVVFDFWDERSRSGIALGPFFDFGTIGINQQAAHGFNVVNLGGAAATLAAPGAQPAPPTGFIWTGGTFPGIGGTCGTTLDAGRRCLVSLSFVPPSSGEHSGPLTIDYDNGNPAATRGVSGRGTSRAVLAFDRSDGGGLVIDMGTVAMNAVQTVRLQVSNVGGSNATAILPAALAAPFGVEVADDDCDRPELKPGESCFVDLTFAPLDAHFPGLDSQLFSTVVALEYHDGAEAQLATRAVRATATRLAHLVMLDDMFSDRPATEPFDFGVVPDSVNASATVWLENRGAEPVIDLLVSLGASEPFAVSLGDSGNAQSCAAHFEGAAAPGLEAGERCSLVLGYQAVGDTSAFDQMRVDYLSGPGAGTPLSFTRPVLGRSTTRALLVLQPAGPDQGGNGPFDFGLVGTSRTFVFSVSNRGAALATITALPALPAPFAYTDDPSSNECYVGRELAPNSTEFCTLTVVLTRPQGIEGYAFATLALSYDDDGNPVTAAQYLSRDVMGMLIGSARLVIIHGWNDQPIDFGETSGEVTLWVTVRNVGGDTATQFKAQVLGGDEFGITQFSACSETMPPEDECQIRLLFKPNGPAGPRSASLNVSYEWNQVLHATSRALVGTSLGEIPELRFARSLCPDEPCDFVTAHDFGPWGIETSHTFYLVNTGSASASLTLGGGLQDGFSILWGSTLPYCSNSLTLNPGQSCWVPVTFEPQGAPAWRDAVLEVFYSGGLEPSAQLLLSAEEITEPRIRIEDWGPFGGPSDPSQPFNFGEWGMQRTHVFHLHNTGGSPAFNITGLAASTGPAAPAGFEFIPEFPGTMPPEFFEPSPECDTGFPLEPGGRCWVALTFNPTGLPDALLNGSMTISYEDTGGTALAPVVRAVQGTPIIDPRLRINDWPSFEFQEPRPEFDYGRSGVPQVRPFYVFNYGGSTATVLPALAAFGPSFKYNYDGEGYEYPGTEACEQTWSGQEVCPCGPSIASGVMCRLEVLFDAEGVTDEHTGTLVLDYENAGGTPMTIVAERALKGTHVAEAELWVLDYYGETPWGGGVSAPGALWFGVSGAPVERTAHIYNLGASDATSVSSAISLDSPFAYKGGSYPGTGGTCGDTIPSGETCSIMLTFAGGPNSSYEETLEVDYSGGVEDPISAKRDLMAQGIAGALLIWGDTPPPGGPVPPGPDSVNFGKTGIDLSRTLFVRNIGSATATTLGGNISVSAGQTRFVFSGAAEFPGVPEMGSPCSGDLGVGQSCSLAVALDAPDAQDIDSFEGATLAVTFGGGGPASPLTRWLEGQLTTGPALRLRRCPSCSVIDPADIQFGTWGTATSETLWLSNIGATAATGVSFTVNDIESGPPQFSLGAETCGSTVNVGPPCSLDILFAPSGNTFRQGDVQVWNSGSFEDSATLFGIASTRAHLRIEDSPGFACEDPFNCSPFTFEPTPADDTNSHTFTLRNTGAVVITPAALPFTNTAFAFFPSFTCNSSMAPGDVCQLQVNFTPPDPGQFSDSINLSYSDSQGTQWAIRHLSGAGTP